MNYETIEITKKNGVAILLLNRPDLLNALTTTMFAELSEALTALEQDASVRVLLLSGKGKGFCAGLDLNDSLTGLSLPGSERVSVLKRRMDDEVNAMVRKLQGFSKPKVIAVNGVAAGGGLGLALCGDIVIAARSASFIQVFVPKLGLIPDLGCTWFAPRLIGRARAVAWAMLGDRLPADQAAEWGLIWKCFDDNELMHEAEKLAERLAAGPPQALAAVVAALDAGVANTFSDQLDYERDANAVLNSSADFQEGVDAFREKRAPRFGGRITINASSKETTL